MGLWSKFKTFLVESRRVFRVTKKPTMEEFKIIVKVTSLGALVIGALGFLIHLISRIWI